MSENVYLETCTTNGLIICNKSEISRFFVFHPISCVHEVFSILSCAGLPSSMFNRLAVTDTHLPPTHVELLAFHRYANADIVRWVCQRVYVYFGAQVMQPYYYHPLQLLTCIDPPRPILRCPQSHCEITKKWHWYARPVHGHHRKQKLRKRCINPLFDQPNSQSVRRFG